MFLSLRYAAQEAFRTHLPIEIQKAEGFRAHRGNSRILIIYNNASTEPNDGGRAIAVGNCISCCHPSCPAGIRAGQQNTNSDRYRERACRGVGTGWSFRAHRRYGHQFQVHGTTLSLPANREPFASIAVALGSRVSPKLKAKIWANEFIKFRSLLISAPNQDRYSVCLTPSPNSSNQPRLTLEPCHPSKKYWNLYSIFVAMKYSEIVRDISS